MKKIFLIFCIFLVSEYSVSDDWYDYATQTNSASSPTKQETTSTGSASGGAKDEKPKEGFSFSKMCKTPDEMNIDEEKLGNVSNSIVDCEKNKNSIPNLIQKINTFLSKSYGVKNESINSSINLLKDEINKVKTEADKLKNIEKLVASDIKECGSRGKTTDLACCENTSPQVKQARNLIGGVLPTLQGASAKLACSKFKTVMTTVSGLLTTWNGVCAGSKAYCESACSKSLENIKNIEATISTYDSLLIQIDSEIIKLESSLNMEKNKIFEVYKNQTVVCKDTALDQIKRDAACTSANSAYDETNKIQDMINLLADPKTVIVSMHTNSKSCRANLKTVFPQIKNRADNCEKWGADLAASMVGIGGLIVQAKQKHNCGPAEEANTCNPSAPTAATCAAFCAEATNKSNPACRCILNPLASGCLDGSGRGVANGSGGGNFNAMNFNKPAGMGPGNDTTTNPAPEFGGPSSGASGGGGGRGGGGGIGGGGSVLGSSGKPGGGAAGKSGSNIDTKIISGVEGGGGGGGSKAGGGYAANPAIMNKLKADLKARESKPKYATIEEDPRVQITGAGGKTNWEKVSERYKDMLGQMIKEDEQ